MWLLLLLLWLLLLLLLLVLLQLLVILLLDKWIELNIYVNTSIENCSYVLVNKDSIYFYYKHINYMIKNHLFEYEIVINLYVSVIE